MCVNVYVRSRLQVFLAMDSGVQSAGVGGNVPDYVFNTVFGVEFVLKVVAFGFKDTGPSAYIRNMWNVTDLVVLIGSIVCTQPPPPPVSCCCHTALPQAPSGVAEPPCASACGSVAL